MKFNLLENIWIRVIAIALAILLWFHVATEKVYNYQIELPITEITLQDSLSLVSNPVNSLDVMVIASGKKLLRKKWRRLGVRINATSLESGDHSIALTPANTSLVGGDSRISLDEILFPSVIDISIDFTTEKMVPVMPNIEAIPDDGYAVASINIPKPSHISVTGPRSYVDKINSISTRLKSITGLRNDITLILPVAIPPDQDLKLEPDSVEVSIIVVPVKTRLFSNIKIVLFNAPGDKTVLLQPASVNVELTGTPYEIDALDKNAIIATADYRQLSADGKLPLSVECPSRFKIKDISHTRVGLRFAP